MTTPCRPDPTANYRTDQANETEEGTVQTWTERESFELTVSLVVKDGHRMRLLGVERRAVIERMTAAGHDRATIAHRLRITVGRLEKWASENRVGLPRTNEAAWWKAVAHPSRRVEYRRRHETNYRAGRVAA